MTEHLKNVTCCRYVAVYSRFSSKYSCPQKGDANNDDSEGDRDRGRNRDDDHVRSKELRGLSHA